MGHEYERNHAEEPDVNPVALSLTGGFIGTVSGLKKGGVGGAVLGGLVGGTAGYVTGAVVNENDSLSADHDRGPVSIAVDEEDDVDGDEN